MLSQKNYILVGIILLSGISIGIAMKWMNTATHSDAFRVDTLHISDFEFQHEMQRRSRNNALNNMDSNLLVSNYLDDMYLVQDAYTLKIDTSREIRGRMKGYEDYFLVKEHFLAYNGTAGLVVPSPTDLSDSYFLLSHTFVCQKTTASFSNPEITSLDTLVWPYKNYGIINRPTLTRWLAEAPEKKTELTIYSKHSKTVLKVLDILPVEHIIPFSEAKSMLCKQVERFSSEYLMETGRKKILDSCKLTWNEKELTVFSSWLANNSQHPVKQRYSLLHAATLCTFLQDDIRKPYTTHHYFDYLCYYPGSSVAVSYEQVKKTIEQHLFLQVAGEKIRQSNWYKQDSVQAAFAMLEHRMLLDEYTQKELTVSLSSQEMKSHYAKNAHKYVQDSAIEIQIHTVEPKGQSTRNVWITKNELDAFGHYKDLPLSELFYSEKKTMSFPLAEGKLVTVKTIARKGKKAMNYTEAFTRVKEDMLTLKKEAKRKDRINKLKQKYKLSIYDTTLTKHIRL